jgi:hypothetical protein
MMERHKEVVELLLAKDGIRRSGQNDSADWGCVLGVRHHGGFGDNVGSSSFCGVACLSTCWGGVGGSREAISGGCAAGYGICCFSTLVT